MSDLRLHLYLSIFDVELGNFALIFEWHNFSHYVIYTPVFLKENSKHRKFGCWYLRIRPKNKVSGSLEGIIKIEKMAVLEEEGLDSSVVDRVSFKCK